MKIQASQKNIMWRPLTTLPVFKWEFYSYAAFHTLLFMYGVAQLYITNDNPFIGNDFTFQTLIEDGLTHLRNHICPLLIFTMVSRIVRVLFGSQQPVVENIIQIILGIIGIGVTHGPGHLLWLIPYFVLWQNLVSRRSQLGIWTLALLTYLSLDSRVCNALNFPYWPYYLAQKSGLWIRRDEFFIILAYFQCRAIIIGVDLCKLQREKTPLTLQLTLAWRYFFYPVTFFSGSLIDLRTFSNYCQTPCPLSKRQSLELILRAIRLVLMWVACELSSKLFNYKYVLIQMEASPLLLFCALMVALFQFYSLNVVFFGWSYVIARLDGFLVPEPPKCFFSFYTTAQIWRDFDRGLGFFLKQYIYEELDNKMFVRAWSRRIFNVACCFLFIIFFHGFTEKIVFWTGVNYCARLFELFIDMRLLRGDVGNWMMKNIDLHWLRRICTFFVSQYWLFFAINSVLFMGNFSWEQFHFSERSKGWSLPMIYLVFSVMFFTHYSIAISYKQNTVMVEQQHAESGNRKNKKKK